MLCSMGFFTNCFLFGLIFGLHIPPLLFCTKTFEWSLFTESVCQQNFVTFVSFWVSYIVTRLLLRFLEWCDRKMLILVF